jgi:DNA-binding GntR family transcriptional regulator
MTNILSADWPTLQTYKTKQELAYKALRDAIVTCRFPPGQRLLEHELAQQLGISRSPIREALKRLAHEGLVNEVPHVGVTVAEVGLDSLHELYLIVAALEGLACREACQRLRPETLQQMEESLTVMQAALAALDVEAWTHANVAFHRFARQDCGLPHLLRLLDETWSRMQRYQIYQGAAAERAVQSQSEHTAIFEAMRNADPEESERRVKEHYLRGDRQFSEYLHALAEETEISSAAGQA